MVAKNWPVFQKGVLAHEGSTYTDGVHPYDPGGPTRWGITLIDARLHWKANATADDVRNMPQSVAIDIYKSKYWNKVRADELPAGLDYSVCDYGVNSGVGRAGKVLRRCLNLPDNTSVVNDMVLAAAHAQLSQGNVNKLIVAICDERLRFLQGLAIWPTYKNGWTTRVREVKALSLKLADAPNKIEKQDITPTADSATIAKGMVPVQSGAQQGSAGAIAAAGAAAAQQAHSNGARPWLIAAIVVVAVVLAIGGWLFWHWRQQKQQEKPA